MPARRRPCVCNANISPVARPPAPHGRLSLSLSALEGPAKVKRHTHTHTARARKSLINCFPFSRQYHPLSRKTVEPSSFHPNFHYIYTYVYRRASARGTHHKNPQSRNFIATLFNFSFALVKSKFYGLLPGVRYCGIIIIFLANRLLFCLFIYFF